MPKTLPEIIYAKDKITPIIDARSAHYHIPYFKGEDYFNSIDSYTAFIKGCEKAVRQNDRYSKDIDDNDASIEMHHGPIFTLYDICSIVVEYFLAKKWKITTFRIADMVLDEHQKNRIQVVMLSSTIHEQVHQRNIFINMKQAYGDINAFLHKYGPYMNDEYKEKLNNYIDRSLLKDSTDFGILELNKKLYKN